MSDSISGNGGDRGRTEVDAGPANGSTESAPSDGAAADERNEGAGRDVLSSAGPRDRLDSTIETARRTIRRVVEVLQGSQIEVTSYDPNAHGPLLAYDGEAGFEEVERYWVDAPFSFVSIQHDPRKNRHLYHAVEPRLRADERVLLETLFDDVRDPLLYRERGDDDVETLLRETIHEFLERYGAEIEMPTFYRLFYYIHRDFRGYGRLDPIMHDPRVEDVSCDGYDLPIFVYHDEYTDIETNVSFGKEDLDRFVVRLAQHSGRHISIGDPMVETTLPDGSRAELALGEEVTPRGSAFTVRKYADEPFTPIDLLEYGTFSVEQLAYLWLAIEHNKSLLFAGGTASGKTTSMNAISMFIPPRSKVLTIEDTRELQLYHDNWLSSVTRERIHEGKDVTMYDLLRSALRHRPEYIVVGEVRGEEAMTLFQAMNTGHTTYSTMHADSVQTVINRLENDPINVPRSMVQSLDILSVQTLTRLDDGRVRRNKVLAEIEGVDQRTGELDYSTAYTWDGETDSFRGSGSHVLEAIRDERGWTQRELLTELENRERFLEYLRANGIADYRRFTALVNEYYADTAPVLETIGEADFESEAEAHRNAAASDRAGPNTEPDEPIGTG
ncbi:type II/IV secretion system ATPase subunit [Halosolutus gelatinilyticus]|uniref:type II/IV secretion system ATPase subunit n=1 Tax=Halosolutus gelatinilyticus TaxID=2931975 RepID=UPI001FF57F8E|nr:type II/IV secretion system ATPase subunit [Halosolutus gelatinilyticus]